MLKIARGQVAKLRIHDSAIESNKKNCLGHSFGVRNENCANFGIRTKQGGAILSQMEPNAWNEYRKPFSWNMNKERTIKTTMLSCLTKAIRKTRSALPSCIASAMFTTLKMLNAQVLENTWTMQTLRMIQSA